MLIKDFNQGLGVTKAANRSVFCSLQFLRIKSPQQHYKLKGAKKVLYDAEQDRTQISHARLLFIT